MMRVIPLGFELKTHSLKAVALIPTELTYSEPLNADAKLLFFLQSANIFGIICYYCCSLSVYHSTLSR